MADPTQQESGISDGSKPYTGWPAEEQKPEEAKKRRRKRRDNTGPGALSINSLMDIVTIILVYLLKSYATSPIEVTDPAIEIPTSTSAENVEDAAVVMVTGPFRKTMDQATGQTVVVPNTPNLIVDSRTLFALNTVTGASGQPSFRIPSERKSPQSDTSFVVAELKSELEKAREKQELAAQINEKDFTGKVVILADKQTPYRVLMDLLVTCGQAGFGEFKFAIVKDAD